MTIAVDFDGVIHRYSLGWHDGTIYDTLMPGADDALHLLRHLDAVFIHSTRDPEQIHQWMLTHSTLRTTTDDTCPNAEKDYDPPCPTSCSRCEGTGRVIFWNNRDTLLITPRKLPAVAYVDDRAVRFTNWPDTLKEIFAP
ncbi:MAG TPA: hypothetical protein VIM84_04055 [Gemmatimonadales bacterium]